MSTDNKKNAENDVLDDRLYDKLDNMYGETFGDGFEVIYEGDLPELGAPKDDNFKDVLANLPELDNTKKIDYLEENYTTSFEHDDEYKEAVEAALNKKLDREAGHNPFKKAARMTAHKLKKLFP